MTRMIFTCGYCGRHHRTERDYVPAGALIDARAEVERLRVLHDECVQSASRAQSLYDRARAEIERLQAVDQGPR